GDRGEEVLAGGGLRCALRGDLAQLAVGVSDGRQRADLAGSEGAVRDVAVAADGDASSGHGSGFGGSRERDELQVAFSTDGGGGVKPAGVEPPDLGEAEGLLVGLGGVAEEDDAGALVVVEELGLGEVGVDDGDAVVVGEAAGEADESREDWADRVGGWGRRHGGATYFPWVPELGAPARATAFSGGLCEVRISRSRWVAETLRQFARIANVRLGVWVVVW